MKKLIIITLSLLIFLVTYAQNNAENEIRKLENELSEAFLKKDTITLAKLFSPRVVLNSPANKVVSFQNMLVNIRNGGSDKESLERTIERITFTDNIAIVMGNETAKPTGQAYTAGKTVIRRYTNIWMNIEKKWQIVARQSTIISIE